MSAVYPVSRHRLKVEDFQKLGSAGILAEDDRVELIEGDLIDMAPIGSEHAGVVSLLAQLVTLSAGQTAIISTQNPLMLDEYSQPQPDILVLKPREDYYRKAHPQPEDILLLIEVADTSARFDREIKIPLYARHNVLEIWLVDLAQRCVEVYRLPQPDAGLYQQVSRYAEGILTPERIGTVAVDVARLF
jgi:Uma2 family endonuclease